METQRFDYVIVGAGSAGCVLAARLSEDPATSVAVLEAGGRNGSILVGMPAGISELVQTPNPHNWGFLTEPEAELGGRRIFWPRGRGWGGSSAINAMIYTRGHPRDYDLWRQRGLPGWGWDDVLPYFRRAEDHERGACDRHGAGGPLKVGAARSDNPLYPALLQAAREAGLPVTDDFNGAEPEGFGRYDLTLRDGRRCSAADAYLRPALASRRNLHAVTEARAARVLFDQGRAVGVEYRRGGRLRQVFAEREVILAAGAVQTPQLLLLSGVGDPERLRAAGVEPLHALPGVGENLQDHLDVPLAWTCLRPVTAQSLVLGWRKPLVGLRWLLRRDGPGAENWVGAGAFLRTRPELERPDVQVHMVLALSKIADAEPPQVDGFQLRVCHLTPASRGRIGLYGPDPFAAPRIEPNYLSSPGDLETLREGTKLARRVAASPALDAFRGEELHPGADAADDAALDAWIRRVATTIYHPVGTCRMGPADDPAAVVDATLKVRGLAGLRVVDASVMPAVPAGNTNAPTIMIAEKAADLIRGRASPAAEPAIATRPAGALRETGARTAPAPARRA